LTTSSFNALALAGRDGHDVLVLNLSAFDAVDGAHCAASKCHRVVASKRPFEGGFSFANFLVDVLALFVFVVLAGLRSERNAP